MQINLQKFKFKFTLKHTNNTKLKHTLHCNFVYIVFIKKSNFA